MGASNSYSIFEAAKVGNVKQVKQFVKVGVDVNEVDDAGCTPLIYASWHGNVDVVRLLIHFGANANLKTELGGFPLSQAAYWGNQSVCKLLLAAGADKRMHYKGCTAAMIAHDRGFHEAGDLIENWQPIVVHQSPTLSNLDDQGAQGESPSNTPLLSA